MKNAATAGVERDFPAWMVWLSREGRYWGAVRRDPRPGQDPTVIADSEQELREALAAQEEQAARGR